MALIIFPRPEVVNSGYADVATASGWALRYITVPAGYSIADHFPHIITTGDSYPTDGSTSYTMKLAAFWQDWANNRIVLMQYANGNKYFRVRWEIRKRPPGWKLYQATHDLVISSTYTTPADHNITLSSALRSATKHGLQNPFRGSQYQDINIAGYSCWGTGLRVTGIQQVTYSTNYAMGGAGATYRIPVVILH